MMTPRRFLPGTGTALLALACLALGAPGCQSFSRRPEPPTQTDRLIEAYPELLSGGRFVVIADFEIPAHMELFQLIDSSGNAKCILDSHGGRAESGRSCLLFTAGSPDDTLVISNAGAERWYLKRDWRDYDLLLVSVRSPKSDVSVDLQIASGTGKRRTAVHSSLALQKGWNLVHLDLAEVAERIPLDDVREMRLSASGFDKPIDLRFDDLLLTARREALHGDPRNTVGDLYVQRVGRHWNTGAGGRFEITFANGQIVRWHNLVHDPYRLRNLIEGTTLGPSPMVLRATDGGENDFSSFGRNVMARSRIIEMNSVRVVVECDWRFVEDADTPLVDRPFQRWTYTIYPTGQMYVVVESTAKTPTWSASELGLAVTVATRTGDGLQTHTAPQAAQPPAFATMRTDSTDSLVLFALNEPHAFTPVRERLDSKRGRASLVASRPVAANDVERWLCGLTLGSAKATSDEETAARAMAFCNPAELKLEIGTPATGDEWNDIKSGFDQTNGCYTIIPEQGRARFVLDGRERPFFHPAFRILDTRERQVWVYADHLIHRNIARDRGGNVIFQLPDIIRDQTTVEVLLRRSEAFPGA